MATIATDVKWGTGPINLFNFYYDKQRSGSTQQYKITVSCEPCTGSSYFGYPIYLEIKVNGTISATKTLKNASPSQWSSDLTYTTGWIDVANKVTGTTPLSIRIYSGSGSSRNTTYSYSLAIDPAPSTIKATDANIESVSTVTFTRQSSSFTHTLSYMPASQSSYTTIFSKKDITSYGWTVPSSLYAIIPEDKTIEVTLRCQTYSGSTLVGTDTCTMTATAAENKCSPTVRVSAVDSNANTVALTGSNKTIIKYHSDVTVTATPTAKNSATIVSTVLKCGSFIGNGTSYTFNDAESIDVAAKSTDSRGYSKTVYASGLTLIDYIKLTANTTAVRKEPTSDTVLVTTKGNYFNGNFGAVANTLRVRVRYKLSTASWTDDDAYTDMAVTISGNTYTATATLTGLEYTNAYSVRVRAEDEIYKYNGSISDAVYNNITANKGIPICDWGEDNYRFNVPVRIPVMADAIPTGNNNVALRLGTDDGQHVDLDTNEIIAKDAPSVLGNFGIVGQELHFTSGSTMVLKLLNDATGPCMQSASTYGRTYSVSSNMYITSSGVLGRSTSSSQRYKRDISDVTDAALDPHAILSIPVRQYRYKQEHAPIDKGEDELYIGLIAEEVAAVYPAAAEMTDDGEIEMWSSKVLIPAMLKIIQEMHQELKELREMVQERGTK